MLAISASRLEVLSLMTRLNIASTLSILRMLTSFYNLLKLASVFCCREAEKLDLDMERRVRTPEEMGQEAAQLRAAFKKQHGASSF